MQPVNPYEAPNASPPANPPDLACPRCKSANVRRPTFTMWGGMVGPRLLDLAVCRDCRFPFNARTGASNRGRIWLYRGVGWTVTIAAFALWYASRH